jgi:hypothetical protein
MESINQYVIEVSEGKVWIDKNGKIHHPFDKLYGYARPLSRSELTSLTFATREIVASPLTQAIKVFYVKFFGEAAEEKDREAWADPLRALILERLSKVNSAWYLSLVGEFGKKDMTPVKYQIERDFFDFFMKDGFDYRLYQDRQYRGWSHEKGWYLIDDYAQRIFIEVPNQHLAKAVSVSWPFTAYKHAIEGYNMETHQLDLIELWKSKTKSVDLFQEVIKNIFYAFYTFPSENIHFAFLTDKLDLNEFVELINLKELIERAREIGRQMTELLPPEGGRFKAAAD